MRTIACSCLLLLCRLDVVAAPQDLPSQAPTGKSAAKSSEHMNKTTYDEITQKLAPKKKEGHKDRKLKNAKKKSGISLEPFRYTDERLFNEDVRHELQESPLRRFEVIFLISLPFSALISAGILQGTNLLVNDSNNRGMPFSHILYVSISSFTISGLIAYFDTKKWKAYRKNKLKKFKYKKESRHNLDVYGVNIEVARYEF